MKLTNKCKEAFEAWYRSQKDPEGYWYSIVNFNGLVDSMKYGIYQDFFDSVGIIVHSGRSLSGYNYYVTTTLKHYQSRLTDTLKEARKLVIEEADEFYNENY